MVLLHDAHLQRFIHSLLLSDALYFQTFIFYVTLLYDDDRIQYILVPCSSVRSFSVSTTRAISKHVKRCM